MPARRADADQRRFFDEFACVKVSRFRATGVIDPAKRQAVIPFPNGRSKLLDVAHTRLKYGGGWSYFICPNCAKLAHTIYLIDDAPRCPKCCAAMNIKHRTQFGFGRDQRRQARDKRLDELIAKLETTVPLRFKPAPKAWQGTKAQFVFNSRNLAERMRRNMVSLRLSQLASQQAANGVSAYQPLSETRSLIDVGPIWRARTNETLQRALDKAQAKIIAALDSPNAEIRMSAARLMLRTKQARDRGLV